MDAPRVLVVLDTSQGWSRGILRGFTARALERGWELLHYHPSPDLSDLVREWDPRVAVVGPGETSTRLARGLGCPVVSVNEDRSTARLASVFLNERAIAELALDHFRSRGLEHVTTFRFSDEPFAVARDEAFRVRARTARVHFAPGWWVDGAEPPRASERRGALVGWLRSLPRPCGVFTCCDAWGRVVARYARAARLRVPEDLALVGVDNDVVECELVNPPLSSVSVPWRTLGEKAADLVEFALARKSIRGRRLSVAPVEVFSRRSSDALAIEDRLVVTAVTWIRNHARGRITVPLIARAVGSSRQRLERRFRASLGRTVQEEVRRARVELAKAALHATPAGLKEIAATSGFTSAALLSVAFQKELGMPPGAYRRRIQKARTDVDG